jgi:hypothetical protein
MAEWLKAADCKSAGQRPTEVRTLLSPPFETRREKPETRRVLLVSGFRFLVSKAGVTQLVESQPSKLLVAGSSPVSRSKVERQKAEVRRRRRESERLVARLVKGLDDKANGGKHFCLLPSAFWLQVSPLSSGVEHVLGKDGVASSTLAEGSI